MFYKNTYAFFVIKKCLLLEKPEEEVNVSLLKQNASARF